jgi:hypothetical protein
MHVKARLDGSEIDDRYLFLKDLLEVTKLGLCKWETTLDNGGRSWYTLVGHGKGSIKISQNEKDTPSGHRVSSLLGSKCYTVKYPFGVFSVYSGEDDKLVYELYQELIDTLAAVEKGPKEFRLATMVKFVFGGNIETPLSFVQSTH